MRNRKGADAMDNKTGLENNIELFERYVAEQLTPREKQEFEAQLREDKEFALDFRIYLFTLKGMCREAEQDNLEFGYAMKKISKQDLLKIIGPPHKRKAFSVRITRERWAWAASIAAVIAIGVFTVFDVHRADMNRLDDTIVAYNYIPDSNRGWAEVTSSDIPSLEKAYHEAPQSDIQAQEDAGMRLAMAYLKNHDRKRAKALLKEMSVRFAEDEEFAAQCQNILKQLQ